MGSPGSAISWDASDAPEFVLVLSEKVGSGNDRECWRHPINPALCVKVAKPEQERTQNDIDYHYGRLLARRGVPTPHLTRVHGWVMTNRGRGLVVDLVRQPDGTPAPPLLEALRSGLIDLAQAYELVVEAFDWLAANRVILADFGPDNFLVRQLPDGRFRLVFVDGLGARHFGMRYWARRTFGFLARKKSAQFRRRVLALLASGFGAAAGGSPAVSCPDTSPDLSCR